MFKLRFLACFFFLIMTSVAQASDWIVERVTAGVSVSANGTKWSKVKVGDAIPNAYWVRTGPRARVLLAKGSERIMYRGDTLAAISVSQPSGQKTRVTQREGSILLSVNKRRQQHTSVVTPHLAAVVKGTVFEVTVERSQSSVRVDRGLVEVSDGNQAVDVPAGQVAKVSASGVGIEVVPATRTSLTAAGRIGLELAEIKSDGRAGGGGIDNPGGHASGNPGAHQSANSGGKADGNSGGNGNSSSAGNGGGGAGGNGGSGRN